MKKLLIVVVIVFSTSIVHAGPCVQTLIASNNIGQICLDGQGNMNFIDGASTQTLVFMGAAQRTLAQLQALTPSLVGLQFYCTTCTQTPLCISTGTALGQIAAVSVSTGATTGFGACK